MRKVVAQVYYKENVIGERDVSSKTVIFNARHKELFAKDMTDMIKQREAEYKEKLKANDKCVKATPNKVIHNDVKFAFLSMLIKMGNEVMLYWAI